MLGIEVDPAVRGVKIESSRPRRDAGSDAELAGARDPVFRGL
jgi:hypothetical protein